MGLTPVLTSFFNSLQDLSGAPSSIPSRQVVQGEGEALVGRFNTLYRQVQTVREQSLDEMAAIVKRVNGISASLADLNNQIVNASSGGIETPNDLLDRRDLLVKELSEYIGVTTQEQEGILNVYIGKGQALVSDTSYNELTLNNSQFKDNENFQLYMQMGNYNLDITSSVKGGKVGGIADFTREILNTAQNSLGRIAVTLSAAINSQHRVGYGLNGENDTGKEFFGLGEVTTVDGISEMELSNAVVETNSNAALSISIPLNNGVVERGPVTANDIEALKINGVLVGDITATAGDAAATAVTLASAINAKSGSTGVTAEVSGDNIRLISTDDITISSASGGDLSGLDDGTYRMVRSSMKELTTDDYLLAYRDTNYTITNQTTHEVRTLTGDEVRQLRDTGVRGGVIHDGLIFSLNTAQGDMAEGDRILVQPMRTAANDITMSITANQISSIAASSQPDEAGNNSNVLEMVALQTDQLMAAGANGRATASMQDSYGQLVSEVGVRTHYADVNRVAQDSILKHAQTARDNNASVNLDEEAANLMKYQQMYQASTRVISMADELFKAVLNAV